MSVTAWLLGRPYWEYSATVAVLAGAVWAIGRSTRANPRVVGFARDLALIAAVFAVYQHTVHYARLHTAGAFDHAREVIDIERALGIANELDLQQLVLPHPTLVQLLNVYYAGVHLPSMILFVLWVLWWHRPDYPAVRNVLVVSTLACVLIQIRPVAPPRLMPELGYVDTALLHGQSVYGTGGSEIAGQLAAMPSIHVAWAAILAWYAVRLSSSPWRWLLVAHLAMTLIVVTATANHWWLDGIVAIAIVAAAIAAQSRWDRWRRDHDQDATEERADIVGAAT